ncbi:hypothetical protein [Kribbella sp. NPDC055071]
MSVFPLGHYGGLHAGEHVVRVGRRQVVLSDSAFAVWGLAHGGQGDVSELVGLGVVVDVPDEPAAMAAFARTHRMDSLFVGLGNSPERLDSFAVGIPGLGTIAMLDGSSFELWQWGTLPRTLWETCLVRARMASPAVDPESVVAGVLQDLRALIAHGCAYLDVALATADEGGMRS